jgi:membrane protease YdiL (CAAX protease family)
VTSTTWESRPELPDGAPPPRPRAEQAWPPWTAFVALVIALVIALVGGVIVAGVAAAFGHELDDTPPGVMLVATLIQDLAFVATAILFARMSGPTWAAQFGLRPTRLLPALGWILVLYVGFIVFSGLWQQIVDVPEESPVDDLPVVPGLIMVCLLAPLVEEFFFRGFFFTALRNWKGLWPAAIIAGGVFGGIHAGGSPVGALLPLAVLGIGLCLLYAKTGSLYPCIAVHAVNNAIAFSILEDWTWQIPIVVVGSLVACFLVAVPVSRRWQRPPVAPASAPAPA